MVLPSKVPSLWRIENEVFEEGEVRLQELSALHHELLDGSLGDGRLTLRREEGLGHLKVARDLLEQLLAGTGGGRRLVLLVALLREGSGRRGRDGGKEQGGDDPLVHMAR
jgi:hypothetical protein